jgi:tetratricopeptide (TPR) repeat protein
MVCPHCGAVTTAAAGRCPSCNGVLDPTAGPQVAAGLLTPLPPGQTPSDDVTRLASDTGSTGPLSPPPAPGTPSGAVPTPRTGLSSSGGAALGPLAPGQTFGTRYHIIRLLGAGGMGAVYQAWDDELGVAVAIKVIRPEVTSDPSQAEDLERRFKRELLLARQVTHKNVVRIHDLGEIDGIKYITMPFIQGSDLATILRKTGKLPVRTALRIAKQVVSGLQAAHEAGVVHRDLKPANIMVEDENALIMDFGIARSVSGGGGTKLGAVVGTIEYMAPEQARAEPVDQRADIYAFGLILYDMLLGRRQASRPESAVAELMARMQHAPERVRTVDPDVPEAVEAIVDRCLQPEPAARYQTTAALATDLSLLNEDGHAIAPFDRRRGPRREPVVVFSLPLIGRVALRRRHIGITAAAVLAVGGVAGFLAWDRVGIAPRRQAAVSTQPVSLAVLPFRNASGDESLDWLGAGLAEMLRNELGESSHFRAVPSSRLHQVLTDLRIAPDSNFDPATLRRLAQFTSAETVLWGQYLKFGSEIRITATLQDLRRSGAVPLKADATSEAGLLKAVTELAEAVRQGLSLGPDIVEELRGKAFRPSSQSVQALRFYNEGIQLARQGNYSDALEKFRASTQEDANFALAFAKVAQTYGTLGYDNEAQQFSRKAVELAESLPPQEKYLIAATHARLLNDTKRAIEAYEKLAQILPENSEVVFDLAGLYEQTGLFDKARDRYAQVVSRDSAYGEALLAVGRVEIKRGRPQDSLEYLNKALATAIQLDNAEARATILQAFGVAYKRLNKLDDALRYYEESLSIKRRLGQKSGIAVSLNEIAQVQNRLGKSELARANYEEALRIRREIGNQRGIGDTLLDLGSFYEGRGHYDRALQLYKESLQIQREVGNQNYEAACLNNIGNIYLFRTQFEDARTYFERALQIREKLGIPGQIADTVHNLAETYVKSGDYEQALTQYLRAVELRRGAGDKRGAAIESYSMGTVFEYQGRFGAAVNAKEEALAAFHELRDRSFWLGEILSGYGRSLSALGQADAAAKAFGEALSVGRELQNQDLVGQTLNFQGESAWYRGDLKTARRLFEQAAEATSQTTDRSLRLLSRANLAKIAAEEAPSRVAVGSLVSLANEADRVGLRYLSLECTLHAAGALVATRDYLRARQELERLLARTERLGLRLLTAKGHFLLGTTARVAGDRAQAARHHDAARRILDEIRKEPRSADVIKRADVNPMYASPSL